MGNVRGAFLSSKKGSTLARRAYTERVHFQLPIMEFAHLSSHSVEGETIDCLQHCLEKRNRIEFAVNVDNLQAYLV